MSSVEMEMEAYRARMAYDMILNATFLLEDDGNSEACRLLAIALRRLEERHDFASHDDIAKRVGNGFSDHRVGTGGPTFDDR